MEALIFVGLQGSGKTTFFKQRFFETHFRLNLDMLRTRHRERIFLQACLDGKAKFVVDNTNTLQAERKRYIVPAKEANFRVIGYFFVPDVEGCLRRNATRTGSALIPERAILGTKKQLQEPSFDEGFDELYHVDISQQDGAFHVRKIEQ
jgi:predicted kinase